MNHATARVRLVFDVAPSRRRILICGTTLAVLASSPALAQNMHPAGGASVHISHERYKIETFGVFRNMMLTGDFAAKVQLGAAMAKNPTIGVGALADARGEITICDGKLIISYGKSGAPPDASSESAALLAIASAGNWQNVLVERDVAPAEIESYLATAASAHGIDAEQSFPFEVRGVVASYRMHVNAAPTGGPHAMGLPMAIAVETQGDQIDGRVAGLYVSPNLVGIATHGGERTHSHWVSSDGGSTAHLDRWGLKAGALLLLPQP